MSEYVSNQADTSLTISVVAATVTYGDRHLICAASLDAITRSGVRHVIVVLNGVAQHSAAYIEDYANRFDQVQFDFIELSENLGSAEGFAVALDAASATSAKFVWLLDDDNLPETGALMHALDHAVALSARYDKYAVACVRDTDDSHQLLLAGAGPALAFPPVGSFFGFDIIRRLIGKVRPRRAAIAQTEAPIELPQAPYGGLLLPTEIVRNNDGPRRDFLLYFDDVEYTRRLVDNGVHLELEPLARITEIVDKWADKASHGTYLRGMINSGDRRKIYCSYRNGAFLDVMAADRLSARVRLALNVAVYSAYVTLSARFKNRWFVSLYATAVVRGLQGNFSTSSSHLNARRQV